MQQMPAQESFEVRSYSKPYPFELFLPQTPPARLSLVCMTPILGRLVFFDDLFWERKLARYFCREGLAVALCHRPIFEYRPQLGLEQVSHYLEESILRNKKILDGVLIEEPRVDPLRIGSFGMSFGAVLNCLWAAEDRRLKANVFALGGGNLAEIFLSSRDPLIRSFLADALKYSGLEPAVLKKSLRTLFIKDPWRVGHKLSPENTLMIIALLDRVIPLRFSLELWRRLGKPKTIWIPLGHYFSILALPFLKSIVVRFFKKQFA